MRQTIFVRCLLLWLGTFAAMGSSSAWANGMRSHVYISTLALDALPAGPLKTMLQKPELFELMVNGSFFPDSGYAIKDPYGEMAHWEPFVEQYIKYIRKTFQPPFDQGDAARHVAFVLGASSHSMADQGFDTLFMAKSREVDKADMDEFDLANDVFLYSDKTLPPPPNVWFSSDALIAVFGALNHQVTQSLLQDGMDRAKLAQASVGIIAKGNVDRLREKYPWYATHYLDPKEPGSLHWLGPVIARYWQQIWQRIQGDHSLKEVVIQTNPPDQGINVSFDHKSIGSMFTVFFGFSMEKKTLTAENISLTDSDGQSVPCSISNWGADDWANTLKIRPQDALKPNHRYTITLGTGLKTLYGDPLPQPLTFRFTTQPTPPAEPITPGESPSETTPSTEPPSTKEQPSIGEPSGNADTSDATEQDATTQDPNAPPPSSACGCESTSIPEGLGIFFLLWCCFRMQRRQYE